jgi:hypothetical protein
VLVVLAANVWACQWILGIGNDPFSYTPPAPGRAPDECPHAVRPPPAPDASADEPKNDYVFAVRTVDATGRRPDGTLLGYDLDGVCTCDPRDTSSHAGRASCVSPANGSALGGCDDDGGIDNANAHTNVFSAEVIGPLQEQADALIRCGGSTALIIITEYNGKADDPRVFVAVVPSYGIFEGDAGTADGCYDPAQPPADPTVPPRWDGQDRWSLPEGHYDYNTRQPVLTFPGWVNNYTLVLDTRAAQRTGSIPMPVASGLLSMGTPTLTARIVPQPSGSFRLEDGVMAGRARIEDVLDIMGGLKIKGVNGESNDTCNPLVLNLLRPILCSAADVVASPERDFRGDPCDALSFTFSFTAEPALVSNIKHASPAAGQRRCSELFGGCDAGAP